MCQFSLVIVEITVEHIDDVISNKNDSGQVPAVPRRFTHGIVPEAFFPIST